MKKITFLITFMLSAMLSSQAQSVATYTRTILTGQAYTPITGGTVINTNAGLHPDAFAATPDDGAALVTLPFAFTYGEGTFNQMTFCTNGWVGMGDQTGITTSQSYTTANMFSATVPNNVIGAWFGDNVGNFPAGGGSMVHGPVGTGAYGFEWRNISAVNSYQSTSTINFMIVLYGPESATPGRIELLYGAHSGNLSGNRAIGIAGPVSGPGDYINAINGLSTFATITNTWPGNGNGYRFDPNNAACSTLTGGTIVGGTTIFACEGDPPAPLHVSGATPPLTGVAYQWQQSFDNGTTWLTAFGGTGATTLSYTPPALTGTSVKYRLRVSCSSSEAFSDVATLEGPGAPTIQASGLSVSLNGIGGMVIAYGIGNGTRRMVVVSDSPITDPTGNAAPTGVSLTYAGGQQTIYNNTAITTTMSGIPCTGGTYYVKVYEVTACGTTYYYNTSEGTNTATIVVPPLQAPTAQATGLTLTNPPGQIIANWANGNGGNRIVVMGNTPILDPPNTQGVAAITHSTTYLGGEQQIVYNGVGSSVTISNIPCAGGGPYYIKVFEYDRCGTTGNFSYTFNTATGTNAATISPAAVAAPTVQATNLVVTPGEDSFTATWANGNGNYRMVLVDTQPIPDMADISGPAYSADTSWNNTGPQIVYNGIGSTVTVTAISCNIGDVYYVKVIEYNRCGANPYDFFFNNAAATNTANFTVSGPPQASGLAITSSTPNSIALSWTEGVDTGSLVVISDSPVINDPTDQSGVPALTASTTYQGGQQIVYASTSTTVTVSNLTCGTTYYIKVFSYYRCGTASNYNYRYNTAGTNNTLTFTPQPSAVPLPQATSFAGFTGANLAATSENWYESRINTPAGDTPQLSNPVGVTSNWASSNVFGVTTARVNLVSAIKNEWIISPKTTISAPARVRFKAAITALNTNLEASLGMTTTDDHVRVLISTDGCGIDWTELYDFNQITATSLTNVLTDYSFAIDGSYVGQNIQIAFHAYDGTTDDEASYDFHIADVAIELIPACDWPTVIANPVSALTSTGATVAWGQPGEGTAAGYEYVFSTSDTAPTAAGTPTTSLSASGTTLLPGTQYYMWVRTACTSGFSNWIIAASFTTLCESPVAINPMGASRCGAGTVQLSATAPAGTTLLWYTDATDTTPLATGSTYAPVVSATTTYYVGTITGTGTAATSGSAAPPTSATGFNGANYGVVFNANDDLTLNTVDIYSANNGTVNIGIFTSAGIEIFETGIITVTGGGVSSANIIPIHCTVPKGTGYRLVIKSFTDVSLIRQSSGTSFPYTGSDGKLNVTSSWTTSAITSSYYYFYNLNYTSGCRSTRTAVTATIHNNPNTPTGAASQVITVTAPDVATIEDIAVTETGVIWYATEAAAIAGAPALAAGTEVFAGTTYYGTLPAGSCVPLAVTITEILGSKGFDRSQFTYYPNPVKDVLTLKYTHEISGVEVYNLLGQKIMHKTFNSNEAVLDISAIADGNYILRVSSKDAVQSVKIVKKN